MKSRLILASASPRRRQLLEEHGFEPVVRPADVKESEACWLTARELVLLNARRKCAAVAASHPDEVTIGVDTLVALDGAAIGKPRDLAHAREILGRLSGRRHLVYTGVCLARGTEPQSVASFVEITQVTFLSLRPPEIDAYLARIEPLDKAGAYAAQEHHEMIIARTEGSWSNILGLPMERLKAVLAEAFAIHPRPRTAQ